MTELFSLSRSVRQKEGQSGGGIAQCASHQQNVARLCSGPRERGSTRNRPKLRDIDREAAWARIGVPARKTRTVAVQAVGEAVIQPFQTLYRIFGRQSQRDKGKGRIGAHRRHIRQVDRRRLPADRVRVAPVPPKMSAFDQQIR